MRIQVSKKIISPQENVKVFGRDNELYQLIFKWKTRPQNYEIF